MMREFHIPTSLRRRYIFFLILKKSYILYMISTVFKCKETCMHNLNIPTTTMKEVLKGSEKGLIYVVASKVSLVDIGIKAILRGLNVKEAVHSMTESTPDSLVNFIKTAPEALVPVVDDLKRSLPSACPGDPSWVVMRAKVAGRLCIIGEHSEYLRIGSRGFIPSSLFLITEEPGHIVISLMRSRHMSLCKTIIDTDRPVLGQDPLNHPLNAINKTANIMKFKVFEGSLEDVFASILEDNFNELKLLGIISNYTITNKLDIVVINVTWLQAASLFQFKTAIRSEYTWKMVNKSDSELVLWKEGPENTYEENQT